MPRPVPPPPESLALTTLRRARGITGAELADLAGITKNKLSRYEMGDDVLHREKLDELASVMGYDPADVDSMIFGIVGATTRLDKIPLSPVDPTLAERRRIRQALGRLAQAEREGLEEQFIRHLRIDRAKRDRKEAEDLVFWLLEEPDLVARRELIEASRQYKNWAVAERLCHESERLATSSAEKALEVARVALHAAELAPGSELWKLRLQGYAWVFVGNALRVGGDMPAANQAFSKALSLWEAGAAADPGLLGAWRVPDREASLRRQDDPSRALALHDEALVLAPPEVKGRILVNKALTLQQSGEPEFALKTLSEAEPFVSGHDEPRLLWGLRFNFIVILCDLGRFLEAEHLVSEISALAAEMGNELDIVRVLWLRGRIDSGLGRDQEAEAAFEQVRQAFRYRGIAYDFAKITLELASLLSKQGRLKEVRSLATQTLWIFKAQALHSEAEKALKLFCEVAATERLTVDLTQHILKYLEKAEKNPGLRFHE